MKHDSLIRVLALLLILVMLLQRHHLDVGQLDRADILALITIDIGHLLLRTSLLPWPSRRGVSERRTIQRPGRLALSLLMVDAPAPETLPRIASAVSITT